MKLLGKLSVMIRGMSSFQWVKLFTSCYLGKYHHFNELEYKVPLYTEVLSWNRELSILYTSKVYLFQQLGIPNEVSSFQWVGIKKFYCIATVVLIVEQ